MNIFLHDPFPDFWRQGFSLNCMLANGNLLVSPHCASYRHTQPCPAFHVALGDSNSHPHACTASTCSTILTSLINKNLEADIRGLKLKDQRNGAASPEPRGQDPVSTNPRTKCHELLSPSP